MPFKRLQAQLERMAMTPEGSAYPSPDETDAWVNGAPTHPPNLVVSLATPALLVGLVLGRSLAEAIQQVGLVSEEIFRGDRLPILTVTTAEDPLAQPSETNPNADSD